MLHARRKRLRDLAEREGQGESFWTEEFFNSTRGRIVQIMRSFNGNQAYSALARELILEDEGVFDLGHPKAYDWYDFEQYALTCDDEMMPTVVEAWAVAAQDEVLNQKWRSQPFEEYEGRVNVVLREDRISFELVNGEMVPFASRELHAEVVVPTLNLLSGAEGWSSVETAYQNALAEIAAGNAEDAITDAGTALQEALTQLGCDGNALGPLIKSAKTKGLLSNHDGPMLDAIYKVADWVSADRSNNGDAHNARQAHVDDAWLIVHIVGALILRLSKATARP